MRVSEHVSSFARSKTCSKSGVQQSKKAEWLPIVGTPEYATMQLGVLAAKDQLGGRWKWPKSTGDGKANYVLMCNAHVDCEYKVRIHRIGEEKYVLQTKGEHTEEVNEYRRANSILKYETELELRRDLDKGVKAAGFYCSSLKRAAEALKGQGKDPLDYKLESGGLEGVLL